MSKSSVKLLAAALLLTASSGASANILCTWLPFLCPPPVVQPPTRPVPVPEPGTLALLGASLVGLGLAVRRRK